MAFLISDLVNEVLVRCENRTTDTARAQIWLRDALLEITSNPELRNEFDELEVIGPKFNLSGGSTIATSTQEYAFSNLISPGDYNLSTLSVLLWTDPPGNSNRVSLDNTSYTDGDRTALAPGLPTRWYRYADTMGFIPMPDKNYQVQIRAYRMHPITDSNLGSTQILIARDWNEVLVWAAVERGFAELLEFEKANAVHNMLYGDPETPQRPGLIAGRKRRREKEAWRRQAALRPIIRRFVQNS